MKTRHDTKALLAALATLLVWSSAFAGISEVVTRGGYGPGQAALQASDPKVSGLMLQIARDLKLSAGDSSADGAGDPAAQEIRPSVSGGRPASSPLSDREREVAELLLLGMPYRDIGAQLFISAKTVEHHVARIRRRLGAESRSEMLSMLRAIMAPEVPAGSPS